MWLFCWRCHIGRKTVRNMNEASADFRPSLLNFKLIQNDQNQVKLNRLQITDSSHALDLVFWALKQLAGTMFLTCSIQIYRSTSLTFLGPAPESLSLTKGALRAHSLTPWLDDLTVEHTSHTHRLPVNAPLVSPWGVGLGLYVYIYGWLLYDVIGQEERGRINPLKGHMSPPSVEEQDMFPSVIPCKLGQGPHSESLIWPQLH